MGRGPQALFPWDQWFETISGFLPSLHTHFSTGSVLSLERRIGSGGSAGQAQAVAGVATAATTAHGRPLQNLWERSQNCISVSSRGPGAREASSPVATGPENRHAGFLGPRPRTSGMAQERLPLSLSLGLL